MNEIEYRDENGIVNRVIDEDGHEYILAPYPLKRGEHASVGCDLKHWGGACCGKHIHATCNPEGLFGRHVWIEKCKLISLKDYLPEETRQFIIEKLPKISP